MMRRYGPHRHYSDEARIGACADYLLGKPMPVITYEWKVPAANITYWIKKTGSFKLRNRGQVASTSKIVREVA